MNAWYILVSEIDPLIDKILFQQEVFVKVGLSIMQKIVEENAKRTWDDADRAELIVRTEVDLLMQFAFLMARSRLPSSEDARKEALLKLSKALYGGSKPNDERFGSDFYHEQGPTVAFWLNLCRAFKAYPSLKMHMVLARVLLERLEPFLELLKDIDPDYDPEQLLKQVKPSDDQPH